MFGSDESVNPTNTSVQGITLKSDDLEIVDAWVADEQGVKHGFGI